MKNKKIIKTLQKYNTLNNIKKYSLSSFSALVFISQTPLLAIDYNCTVFGGNDCNITISGSNNTMNISGDIPNYTINTSSSISAGSHIIVLKDFTHITNFTYNLTNGASNPELLLQTHATYVLEIDKMQAPELNIVLLKNTNTNILPLFKDAIFKNFTLSEVAIVPENSNWSVLAQKKSAFKGELHLLNPNTSININYTQDSTPSITNNFFASNDTSIGNSISLTLTNIDHVVNIRTHDNTIAFNNLIFNNASNNSLIVLYGSNIATNNLIANNNLYILGIDTITMQGYINVKNLSANNSILVNSGTYNSAFIVEHISFADSTKSNLSIENQNMKLGKDSNPNSSEPIVSNKINTLSINNSNVEIRGSLEVERLNYTYSSSLDKDFAVINGSLKNPERGPGSYPSYSTDIMVNNFILDNASFKLSDVAIIANNVEITKDYILSSQDTMRTISTNTMLVDKSSLFLSSLTVTNGITIKPNSQIASTFFTTKSGSTSYLYLDKTNIRMPAIVSSNILASGSTWNIDVNGYGVINKNRTLSYIVARAYMFTPDEYNDVFEKLELPTINTTSTPSWILYKYEFTKDTIFLTASRVSSYNQVLLNAGIDNTFSNTLASSIDTEIEDSNYSDDIAEFMSRIDAYSRSADDLYKNLDSFQPINHNNYINTLSTNDSNTLEMIQENLFILNTLWMDFNYNWGENYTNYNDKISKIMLGYTLPINPQHLLALSFGGSLINMNSTYSKSDINNISVGLTYGYTHSATNIYSNISLIGSINNSTNVRYDGIFGKYNSKNSYNDTLLGLNAGKDFVINQYIKLINNVYTNINYITMNAYNENTKIGYNYNNQDYNIIDSGYKIGFKYERINDYLWWKNIGWEASSAFGYKFSSGGGNDIILKVDNTQVNIESESLDLDGLVVKPKLAINYNYYKVKVEGAYEFEYHDNGYHQNKIKVLFKYKTN